MSVFVVVGRVEYSDDELTLVESASHKAAINEFLQQQRAEYEFDEDSETLIYVKHVLECDKSPSIHRDFSGTYLGRDPSDLER